MIIMVNDKNGEHKSTKWGAIIIEVNAVINQLVLCGCLSDSPEG